MLLRAGMAWHGIIAMCIVLDVRHRVVMAQDGMHWIQRERTLRIRDPGFELLGEGRELQRGSTLPLLS